MPIFITQGHYSRDAIKGMIAKPEDRTQALAKLAKAAGGKLLGYYVTFGEYDYMVITEMPSYKEAAAVVLTQTAGGATGLKTTVAMTTAEAKEVFAAAGDLASSFRPAGSR